MGARAAVSAGLGLVAALAFALAAAVTGPAAAVPVVERGPPGPIDLRGPDPAPELAGSVPVRFGTPREVRIPAIGVTSPLTPLSRAADGTLAAPADYDVAGWFRPGPEPGEPGAAVIAGHVDSRTGPAVFSRLAELRAGDLVEVAYDDVVVRFQVDRVERYPKAAFPAGEVYGPTPAPSLRLITCGGAFDRATGHYRDNVVVYATRT